MLTVLKQSTFIRFVLVGAINTLFGMGIYCLCILAGFQYWSASLISTILGVLFNFKTIGALVFKNNSNRLIFRFVLCYSFVYGLNVSFIKAISLCDLNDYYAGIIAIPITAVCSYFLLKKFVYSYKNEKN
jgi:putative flippase GtrA